MRSLLCALVAIQVLGSAGPRTDPFAFFEPGAPLTAADRRLLARGGPLVKVLPAEGQHLAVVTAVSLRPEVTPDRTRIWIHNVEELRRNEYVLDTRRFSTPPRLDDLDGLTLEAEDLDDIRRCRPGRCDVKLTAAEIAELQDVVRRSGTEWRAAVQQAFRGIVLRRVQAYLAAGHRAFDPYWDHKQPSSPHRAFAGLLKASEFLTLRLPAAIAQLAACPAAFRHGDAFLYWSRERLGGKAVVSATHVVVVPGGDGAAPEALSVGIQIFATHYLEGAIGVTAFVRDDSSRAYLVYLNRSSVDLLGGLWGGVARQIIEGRLRKDGPEILREVADRVAGSQPASVPSAAPER
jgi:hypothetical protein